MMDIALFTHYTQTYGADINHWPAHMRLDAKTLLDGSTQARLAVKEAQGLDQWLNTVPAMKANTRLTQRVLAIPSVCNTSFVWVLRPFKPAMTLAACALFGFAVGMSDLPFNNSPDQSTQMLFGPDEAEEVNI